MDSLISIKNGVEKENAEITVDSIISLFRAADDYCVSSKNLGKGLDILNKSITPGNTAFHNLTVCNNQYEKRALVVEDELWILNKRKS